jgi:hypothetical protein
VGWFARIARFRLEGDHVQGQDIHLAATPDFMDARRFALFFALGVT